MFAALLVIVLAGLAGPLLAVGPRPLVPTVVGEIGRLPDRPSGLDRHAPSRGGALRGGCALRRAQPCPAG